MSVILPLSYFIIMVLSLSFLFNKKVSFAIPLAFILTSILIMLGGYIGDLRIGLILSLLTIIISIVKIVINKLYTKDYLLLFLKENIVILVLFIIIFIYLCLYHKSSHFIGWDEWSHWGPMVKGMYNTNILYCYLGINTTHPEYPPLFQCVEWLFCYLSRGYSEASLYRGMSVFSVSLIFPVLQSLHNKRIIDQIKYSLIFILIISLLLTIDFTMVPSIFTAILLDMQIAIIPGVLAYLIIVNKEEDSILIASYLTAILLTKEIGIAFYLCIIILAIVVKIIINKEENYKKKLLIYIIIPLLIFISWKFYTKDIAPGQFSLSKINIKSLIEIIFANKGLEHQLFVRNNFITALLEANIIHGEIIKNSFIGLIIVLMIAFVLISYNIYKNKIKTIIVSIGVFLGVLGYTFTIFILYLYCFSSRETLQFASFTRYFGSFIFYFISIIVFIVFDKYINNNNHNKQIVILVTILSLLFISNTRQIRVNSHTNDITESNEYKTLFTQVYECCKGKNKILIFDYDYHHHIANYYFYKDNSFASEIIKDNYTENDFINLIKDKYDYIYIWNYNESMKNVIDKLCDGGIESETLYKVNGDKLIKLNDKLES